MRVLIMQELGQTLRIRFLQGVESRHAIAQRLDQSIHEPLCGFRTEGDHQHVAGVIHTAFGNEAPRRSELVELFKHRFSLRWRDLFESGHLARH